MKTLRRAQRLDKLTSPPKVGVTYLVPCVLRGTKYYPVLAESHRDPELQNDLLHFHLDHRFTTEDDLNDFESSTVKIERLASPALVAMHAVPSDRIQYRKKTCLRTMMNYHAPRLLDNGQTYDLHVGEIADHGRLEDLYETHVVDDCKRCPHRGTPLGNLPMTDGKVTCPAHLLKWDVETGKLCRKTVKTNNTYSNI